MKILITTPIYPPEIGGPATYASGLLKNLSLDHNISVITFTKNPEKSKKANILSIPQYRHAFGIIFRQAKLLLQILKIGKKADIIYSQGPIVVGTASIIAGRMLQKKVILKFVGDIAWEESQRRSSSKLTLEEFYQSPKKMAIKAILAIQKWTLKQADKIIVPSYFLLRLLNEHYQIPEKQIEVIYNPVDISGLKPISSKQPEIITSGRLVSHKNFELIIKAFEIYRKKNKKSQEKLIIIGSGPQKKEIQKHLNSSQYRSAISLIPALPRIDYLKRLNNASTFILASNYEGLPHAIIEAMLLKVPVIASKIPANQEVIKTSKLGILTEINKKSISESLEKILKKLKLQKEISLNAQKYAKEQFNWETHSERLIHLFRQELA